MPCFPIFDVNRFEVIASLSISSFNLSMISFSSLKNFQTLKNLVLNARYFQNHFLQQSLWQFFALNSFITFSSLPQKMVSTLSFKKYHFQTLVTFVFNLTLSSNPFSKIVIMTNFWCKYIEAFARLSRKMMAKSHRGSCLVFS